MAKSIALKIYYPAYQMPVKMIQGMSLEEVSAEKVRAILTRNKARDIYDLHFLITKKEIRFNEQMINEKLKYYGMKFLKDNFFNEILSREKNFRRELRGMILDSMPDFSDVISKINEWLK